MNQYKKGFTILELLVVIAIIGILTSIVLVAVGNSRAKAADKAIVSDLLSVRSEGALFFSNNANSYGIYNSTNMAAYAAGTRCPYNVTNVTATASLFDKSGNKNAGVINTALKNAMQRAGGTGLPVGTPTNIGYTRCASNGSSYAVAVSLKTNPAHSWCIDSNGASKELAIDLKTNVAVFAGNATTPITCL